MDGKKSFPPNPKRREPPGVDKFVDEMDSSKKKKTAAAKKGAQPQHRDRQLKPQHQDRQLKAKNQTRVKRNDYRPPVSKSESKSDINESEREPKETPLAEDIYSLMFMASITSQAFYFAIFIFMFQFLFIILLSLNLIDINNSENPLNLPSGITKEVRITQALAIIVAVATHEDLITSMDAFHDGYDVSVLDNNHSATKPKWFLATALHFFIGMIILFNSFILIMQSASVLDLMLNFAALSFVSEIDDVAFWLAKNGFFTDRIQKETYKVTDYMVPTRVKSNLVRRVIFVSMVVILLGFYSFVTYQQLKGALVCQSLHIQFSDSFDPNLAFFSGVYHKASARTRDGRSIYMDQRTGTARIAYCESEGSWTFSHREYAFSDQEGKFLLEDFPDPCDYKAKASPSTTYEVVETGDSTWSVLHPKTKQSVPLDSFAIFCISCQDADREACNNVGECRDNVCECASGSYGMNCEYDDVCPTLELNLRTTPFPPERSGDYFASVSYSILEDSGTNKPIQVNFKPVYISGYNHGSRNRRDMIVFLGRRWAVIEALIIQDTNPNSQLFNITTPELSSYLQDEFHGYRDSYRPYFLSEPVDIGTPKDGSSPVGLSWYRATWIAPEGVEKIPRLQLTAMVINKAESISTSESRQVDTRLLCARCDTSNPCENGVCRDGVCICDEGYSGALCEREPSCLDVEGGCQNGGVCSTADGRCVCPHPYLGNFCEYDPEERRRWRREL